MHVSGFYGGVRVLVLRCYNHISSWGSSCCNIMTLQRIVPRFGCADRFGLVEGDVVLQVGNAVVVTAKDIERELFKWQREQGLCSVLEKEVLEETNVEESLNKHGLSITLVRDGEFLEKRVLPSLLSCDTTTEVLIWNGMAILTTPKAVRERSQREKLGSVYVAKIGAGSPAAAYELGSSFIIEKVDDHVVESLEGLKELIRAEYSTKPEAQEERERKEREARFAGKLARSGSANLGGEFNSRFTRLVFRDLDGRERAKAFLRDDKFFPATAINLVDGKFVAERL